MVRRCLSLGCLVSFVVTTGCSSPTSWRSGMLGACVVRLWSHVVAPVFRELLCLGGPCRGVVFGLTRVVVEALLCFRCFVALCARSEHELQESAAAVVGCACCERGCCFARTAVGFVCGLRIRVGVSRRLREPTCGVAFTGAGLWSVEPVDGVLALLVVPFLLLRWWDFVCPQDREVGFVSHALWALQDGGLVSAMGVWLVVLLWKCQSRLLVVPCVWRRLVVRVSFPYFPLVAQGGRALRWPWCCVAHRGDLRGEGPSSCAILRLSRLLSSCAWFPCGAVGCGDLLFRLVPC
ncbi:hypothetical protein Taro_025514 [Colocasia esculenta]|uniref:Uncharacterized protein n=1 Tax=Colocasia esculenta TaxID=4460 RepID=A0A843VGR9_COLES|nr:hypothetical protein [Colocasia esculenta]